MSLQKCKQREPCRSGGALPILHNEAAVDYRSAGNAQALDLTSETRMQGEQLQFAIKRVSCDAIGGWLLDGRHGKQSHPRFARLARLRDRYARRHASTTCPERASIFFSITKSTSASARMDSRCATARFAVKAACSFGVQSQTSIGRLRAAAMGLNLASHFGRRVEGPDHDLLA